MANATRVLATQALIVCLLASPLHAGIIKNIFQKITNTGNKTEETVKHSVPVCGSGVFSTPNESDLSPEFIFITSAPSRTLGSRNARSPGRERDSYGNSGGHSSGYQPSSSGDGYHSNNNGGYPTSNQGGRGDSGRVSEVAREFRFHGENVSLSELEEHGFNRNAPVTFLMHGFTSGYPLQAWISAIVEAYTIDRESGRGTSSSSTPSGGHSQHSGHNGDNYHGTGGSGSSFYDRENYENVSPYNSNSRNNNNNNNNGGAFRRNRRADSLVASASARNSSNTARNPSDAAQLRSLSSGSPSTRRDGYSSGDRGRARGRGVKPVTHNLFIINWNYAARGILYPRAVANIPIVASFATRFINDKLLDEAAVDPKRIQLIGHSLGAHLAGFIGKNTRTRLGRIYGLDPAGPCFGSGVKDLVYPSSQRLAPSDADEVIAISTNSALLGIDKPLGRYSVFVEGGANQPGCKQSGVFKSLGTLTFDGGDFDTVACSHSRAPNLMTYRFDQGDKGDNCQMVAYACKDWDAFTRGQCGVCSAGGRGDDARASRRNKNNHNSSPLEPVECLRVGLDWQYPGQGSGQSRPSSGSSYGRDEYDDVPSGGRSTRRPNYGDHDGGRDYGQSSSSRRPYSGGSSGHNGHDHGSGGQGGSHYPSLDRNRRDTQGSGRQNESLASSDDSPSDKSQERRLFGSSGGRKDAEVEPTVMFLRTGDTQPYCTFHYQVVLELNEPFVKKDPPMSIILQDSEPTGEGSRRGSSSGRGAKSEQNSLSSDEFGHKFDDRTYTHLLTSVKKLKRIDHGTMIFRDGLKDGHRIIKALHINYMSHSDPGVRQRLSSRLCPVKTDTDRPAVVGDGENRFFFKPCDRVGQSSSSSSSGYENSSSYGGSHRSPRPHLSHN